MRIKTECEFKTSLTTENSSIDGWDEYIEYLNDIIYKRLGDKDIKAIYESDKFGTLEITVGIDEFIDNKDGDAQIIIWIKPKNEELEYNDDDWYSYMKTANGFVEFIESKVSEFVELVNTTIKDIQFPKNENLIFKDERFYMEISPIYSHHTPEYVPFQIDTYINKDDIIDNFYDYDTH